MRICGDNHHDSMIFVWNQACYFNQQNGCGSSPDGKGTYDLMQYTGLKDKYCVEIYEGDIINFSGYVDAIGYITYNENIASYQASNGNSSWLPWPESGVSLEIIGNIYETPELLEVIE